MLSPDIYMKISSEYQRMQDHHLKDQEDLKNHLLTQKKNERYLQRIEKKLKHIEEKEREQREEIEERKAWRE